MSLIHENCSSTVGVLSVIAALLRESRCTIYIQFIKRHKQNNRREAPVGSMGEILLTHLRDIRNKNVKTKRKGFLSRTQLSKISVAPPLQ